MTIPLGEAERELEMEKWQSATMAYLAITINFTVLLSNKLDPYLDSSFQQSFSPPKINSNGRKCKMH